jgi:hypothetical protein
MVSITRASVDAVRRVPLYAAVTAALLIGIGCGIPLVAPSGTAITLLSSKNVVPLAGSADITAVLIEGGQPPDDTGGVSAGVGTPVHNGTVVTFTTTLGRIEPAEAKTTNGRATTRFIADPDQSGVATITAFSGGASQTLDLNVGAAAGARIILTASPNTLPSGGGSAAIEARVEDQQGNSLSGVPVTFDATAGTLTRNTDTTDSRGIASTSLQTLSSSTVTATAGGAEGTLSDTTDITIAPRTTISITTPASISVSTPAAFGVSVQSSGSDTVALTGATLSFGDGDAVSLGTLVSGADAVSAIHLYGAPGIETVTVSGRDDQGNIVSRSTQVAVGQLATSGECSPAVTSFGATVVCAVTVLPATAAIDHYEWDFGDGFAPSTSSSKMSHVFGSTGAKLVTIKVVPARGAALTVFIQVQINP